MSQEDPSTEASFDCASCKKPILKTALGTKNRNHCPFCLASLHVDTVIGDRASDCQGVMLAIGKLLKKDGEEVLVHKCKVCGFVRKNRVAGDDSIEKVARLKVLNSLKFL